MLDDQQGLQGASAQESAMQSDGQHQLFLCIYLCTFNLNKNELYMKMSFKNRFLILKLIDHFKK